MAGAQLVEVTAKTGLDQRDLSAMWQLVATPGSPTLSRDDFSLFMHILRHRANGGALPASMRRDDREKIFAESGGERPVERPAERPIERPVETRRNTASRTHRGRRGELRGNQGRFETRQHARGGDAGGRGRRAAGTRDDDADGRGDGEARRASRLRRAGDDARDARIVTPGRGDALRAETFQGEGEEDEREVLGVRAGGGYRAGRAGRIPDADETDGSDAEKDETVQQGAPDVRVRFA